MESHGMVIIKNRVYNNFIGTIIQWIMIEYIIYIHSDNLKYKNNIPKICYFHPGVTLTNQT